MTQSAPEADPTVVAQIVAAGRIWADQPLAGLAHLPRFNTEFDTALPLALDELVEFLDDRTDTFSRHAFSYAATNTRSYQDASGKAGIAFSHLVFIPVSGLQEDVDELLNDPIERQRIEFAFRTCGLVSERGLLTLLDAPIGLNTLVSLDPSRFNRALHIGITSQQKDSSHPELAPELAAAPTPETRFDMLAELVMGAPSETRTLLNAACLIGLVQERWPPDTDPVTIPDFTALAEGKAGVEWIAAVRGERKAFQVEPPTGPMEAAAQMICGQISHLIVVHGVDKNVDLDHSADEASIYLGGSEAAITLTYGTTLVGPVHVPHGFVNLAMEEIGDLLTELSETVSWHLDPYGSNETALQ